MKRLITILSVALPVLLSGCSEEEDILPEQRQKIVSYLGEDPPPALIPESQVETEPATALHHVGHGLPVYHQFLPSRAERASEVTAASKATITFRAYVFDFSNITDSIRSRSIRTIPPCSRPTDLGLTPECGRSNR